MTLTQQTHARIAPVALLVAVLGAANWYLRPERASIWLVGMGAMAAVWLVVAVIVGRATPSTQSDAERRFIVLSAVTAGFILAVSLGIALARAFGVDGGELVRRGEGIAMGFVLVVIGNTLPKVIGPLGARRCSPAQVQSVQRFTGWTFVLAGLAYMTAWMFVPFAQADDLSTFFCAAAVTLVVVRCVWTFRRRSAS